jgi:hypothetical protein
MENRRTSLGPNRMERSKEPSLTTVPYKDSKLKLSVSILIPIYRTCRSPHRKRVACTVKGPLTLLRNGFFKTLGVFGMYLLCHKLSLYFVIAGADSGRAGHLCAGGQLGDPGVHRGGVLQPCLHCLAVQPGGRPRQSTLRTR